MIYDNWAQMANELMQVIEEKESQWQQLVNAGSRKNSERTDWMAAQLKPILTHNAHGVAWYTAMERAAMASAWYTANGDKVKKQDIRDAYSSIARRSKFSVSLLRDSFSLLQALHLNPQVPKLEALPPYSVILNFEFEFAKPYLSQDDVGLYPIDNPLRKEKVFKLPMIASTAYKGAMRAACRQSRSIGDEAPELLRLFGTALENDTGYKGCLFFYPTYLDMIELTVINAHDRQSGVGVESQGPIQLEGSRSRGNFQILYVPEFGIVKEQLVSDLQLFTESVIVMFTVTGIGGKTSSGFGIAQDEITSVLLKMNAAGFELPAEPDPLLDDDIKAFLDDWGYDEFPRWTNSELQVDGIEWFGENYFDEGSSDYRKLRSRHPEWDGHAQQWLGVGGDDYKRMTVPVEISQDILRFEDLPKQAERLISMLPEVL